MKPTIINRLEKMEANSLSEGSAKDSLSKAHDDIARLQENIMSLYRFIEENVGARDAILERRLRGPSPAIPEVLA